MCVCCGGGGDTKYAGWWCVWGVGVGGWILIMQVRMCKTTLSIILYKHSRAFNSKSAYYMDNVGSGGESMCVVCVCCECVCCVCVVSVCVVWWRGCIVHTQFQITHPPSHKINQLHIIL